MNDAQKALRDSITTGVPAAVFSALALMVLTDRGMDPSLAIVIATGVGGFTAGIAARTMRVVRAWMPGLAWFLGVPDTPPPPGI